ncbi:superoxide dismutase [Fe] [Sutterella massiliensis]|uniref:Superoxide dismutase n=1 Tax=Sutterella massiliensis TaxID=1816689 RepID=A0ABS2DU41_9BURK|nr:Fe-Mn family superoxide dismutase [Sutterella massiliensis]MBM6704814.1 superoxide dismutase [Fe] [Sutterella massiliensis]
MTEFQLPELPYAIDALEPAMSRETLEYHWGKHHRTYVTNLNNQLAGSGFEGKSLEEIIRGAEGGLFNNAAQHFNHAFFWQCLTPSGGGRPQGALLEAIEKTWGSFEAFVEAFSTAAASNFGSGWTWLVKKADGSLAIMNTSNAGTPVKSGETPILTIDDWEHAYYIDHRNARPAFIKAFFEKLVNWQFAEENFAR